MTQIVASTGIGAVPGPAQSEQRVRGGGGKTCGSGHTRLRWSWIEGLPHPRQETDKCMWTGAPAVGVDGAIVLETAVGELEVGIREGTAAWLDVSAQYGRVRNSLDEASSPEQSEATVEVRARTSYGKILIHRATQTTQTGN